MSLRPPKATIFPLTAVAVWKSLSGKRSPFRGREGEGGREGGREGEREGGRERGREGGKFDSEVVKEEMEGQESVPHEVASSSSERPCGTHRGLH